MAVQVLMPKLGATMESGTITQWFKAVGDDVEVGDPLFEVTTDKVDIEVEAEVSGVLLEINCGAKEQTAVNCVVCQIGEPGERPRAEPFAAKVRATPAARRVAHERGVELKDVPGSGQNGRIHGADVEVYAARISPAKERAPVSSLNLKANAMRKVIAQRMVQSAFSAPHVTLVCDADMSAACSLKEQIGPLIEEATGCRLTYTEIVVKAAARALRAHPAVNVTLHADEIIRCAEINIGLAVATQEGLLVPVVRNADAKDFHALTADCKRVASAARNGTLEPRELTGGTFTISNLGMYAVDSFTPIINQPESAILGVGRVVENPVGVRGSIVLRPVVTLSLSFDHRVIDGAPAAAFLTEIKNLLEQPCRLLV